MSQQHRNNPDSEECQRMTRDNKREIANLKRAHEICVNCGSQRSEHVPVTLWCFPGNNESYFEPVL